MMIPLIVFVGVLTLVVGAYYALVVRGEGAEQRKLRKRVRAGMLRQAKQVGLVREADRSSAVGPLAALLDRATGFVKPLQEMLEQSGVKMTVGTFLLATGTLGLAGFLAVQWTLGNVVFALIVGAGLAWVPLIVVRYLRSARMWKFEEQFPEAIDLISRALRAGHTFQSGLAMVADEVEEPVKAEFRQLYERQNFGMPLAEALRLFADRIPVLDAKFFATAVLTQRDAGGNLSEVLDNLSTVIRERFKVKRQVRVISAHGRITGWVLAGLPPGLALVFSIVQPTHMRTLFEDPVGLQMLYGAMALQVIGTLIIRRIVDVEY